MDSHPSNIEKRVSWPHNSFMHVNIEQLIGCPKYPTRITGCSDCPAYLITGCLYRLIRLTGYPCRQLHMDNRVSKLQGREFTHRISERIAGFLPKNERMSDSLIHSFLVSDLSDLLMIAHFL